jgi:hypothetical protein
MRLLLGEGRRTRSGLSLRCIRCPPVPNLRQINESTVTTGGTRWRPPDDSPQLQSFATAERPFPYFPNRNDAGRATGCARAIATDQPLVQKGGVIQDQVSRRAAVVLLKPVAEMGGARELEFVSHLFNRKRHGAQELQRVPKAQFIQPSLRRAAEKVQKMASKLGPRHGAEPR